MNRQTLLATLLALAVTATAQPVPNPDYGSGMLGLEPDPPEVSPPDVSIVSDSLNTILQVDLTGLVPGDEALTQLGDASILTELLADGTLVTSVISNAGTAAMTLQPVAQNPGDLTMLITPATVTIDRFGDNPVPLDDPAKIVDGTLVTWGLIEDLGAIGKGGPITDPAEVLAPQGVQAVADQISLVSTLDPVMELIVIDPEDNILVGTLEEHTSQLPLTDTIHETAADITSKLNTETLTGLDVNSVLSGLKDTLDAVGAVDTNLLGTVMDNLDMDLRIVDLPIDDPKVILDPHNLQMVLVDNGIGKVTAIPGEEKMFFDNDLVTALKHPESTQLTSFVAVGKHGDLTKKVMGATKFHPGLGNYDQLLKKTDHLMKNGITTSMVPQGISCKQQLAQTAAAAKPAFCATPAMGTISPAGGKVLGSLANPELNPKLANSSVPKIAGLAPLGAAGAGLPGGLPDANNVTRPFNLPMGTAVGQLTQFPVPTNHTLDGGTLSYVMPADAISNVPQYELMKWELPDTGIGSLPEIEAPNTNATKNIKCVESCLPDHDLTVLDGVMEGFQAPAMPNLGPVVPMDALTGVLGTVTDAAGNGLTFLPVDLLQKLPIGLNSEVQVRSVGSDKSIFSNTGIPDVRFTVQTSDPLGLSTVTSVYTTNNNGYAVFPVPALGSFQLTGIKEGFASVTGSGQAGAPGSTTGQEYTMYPQDDNAAFQAVKGNGALWGLILVVGLLGLFWARNKYHNKKRRTSKSAKRGGA